MVSFGSSIATAKWHEASSDHFLIYSDQSPKEIRKFSERLERYHDTMRFLFNRPASKPSPSNRLTIYAVNNQKKVRKLNGGSNKYVTGFYIPRAGGSLAIISKVKTGGSKISQSERTLLHEYAHHFLLGSSKHAYPLWLSEGFAEFYSTVKFGRDGSVGVGLPAHHRAAELSYSTEVPIARLLDTKAYRDNKTRSYDSFYGQSWSLYHMLHFSKQRKGQLVSYQKLLAKGTEELTAAKEVFGDLKALDNELSKYLRQRRIMTYDIPSRLLKVGEISVRQLRPGEAAAMPIRIQSKRGVDEEQAAALLPKARLVAAQYPDDPSVMAVLAEAEFDADNDKKAIIAADRAIALDPKQINAHIQKGYTLARMAENADDPNKAWQAVRNQFVKVNKIENDNPIPLIFYYRSYKEQGIKAPQIAIDGLSWALSLAPYDAGLRMTMASQHLENKEYKEAIFTLEPLANSPHQNSLTKIAQKLLKLAETQLKEEPKES